MNLINFSGTQRVSGVIREMHDVIKTCLSAIIQNTSLLARGYYY